MISSDDGTFRLGILSFFFFHFIFLFLTSPQMFGPCHFSSSSSLWSGYTINNDIPIHLRTRDLCFNHITFCLSSFSAREQFRPGFPSSISPQIHSKS